MLKKVTFSIPKGLHDDLKYISRRMGVSSSALITNMNVEPIHDMRQLLELLPENPSPEDIVRSRGASVAKVKERIANLQILGDSSDLFSD